jgi:hypothetical protein
MAASLTVVPFCCRTWTAIDLTLAGMYCGRRGRELSGAEPGAGIVTVIVAGTCGPVYAGAETVLVG